MALNKQQRNKLSKPLTNKQTEGIKIVAANSNIAQEENQRLREQLKQYEIMMHDTQAENHSLCNNLVHGPVTDGGSEQSRFVQVSVLDDLNVSMFMSQWSTAMPL